MPPQDKNKISLKKLGYFIKVGQLITIIKSLSQGSKSHTNTSPRHKIQIAIKGL